MDEVAPEEGFEAACLARLAEYADRDPLALATTKAWLREGVLAEMMAHEHERSAGGWQIEWSVLPRLFGHTAGAVEESGKAAVLR